MKHLIRTSDGVLDALSVKKLIPLRDEKDRLFGYDAITGDGSVRHLTPSEGRQVKHILPKN